MSARWALSGQQAREGSKNRNSDKPLQNRKSMKISALHRRQESRPRTTGRRCECRRRCHSLLSLWCWCRHPATVMKSVGRVKKRDEKRKKTTKQTHMSFPVFSWMLTHWEWTHTRTYVQMVHTYTHSYTKACVIQDRGVQRQEEKSRPCTMTFLTFCVALLKWSLLRLVELDSVTEP